MGIFRHTEGRAIHCLVGARIAAWSVYDSPVSIAGEEPQKLTDVWLTGEDEPWTFRGDHGKALSRAVRA